MATPNFMGTPAKSAVPQNEWLARQLMIQRQMQAADAMQQQAMEAIPTNRSVGGVAIPISPMEGVGQMAKALSSRYQQQTAASEMEKLDAKRREDLANKLREYSDMRAGGVRNRPDMSGEGMTGGLDEQDYGRKPEMVPGDPRAAMVMALTSQHPELHQLGALDARALGETPYAKIDPSKYTPDSIQRFAASGGKDYTALVPRDKLELQNTGGAIVPFNPYSGNPVGSGFPTTQTPNNVATLGQQDRHWGNLSANQIEQDRRAREQIEIARRNSDIAGGRLQNDSTNTYFNTGMPGANVPGGGGVPAPAPSPAPLPQQGGVDPNNLGNIRPPGQSTGFQRFNTPQEGLAAIDQNLQAYGAKGINTIEKIISTWAPPSENNTQAYVASVAQRLGINPQQPLDMNNPAVRHALTTAIMIHEKGPQAIFGANQTVATGGVAPTARPAAAPSATAQSPRELQQMRLRGERPAPSGGTELIEGSPAYIKASGAHAKDVAGLQAMNTKIDSAVAKIDRILDPKNTGAFNSNFGGYNAYVTRLLPGDTQNIGREIDSLKSDLKSAGLEMMRQGGSIGQMTEREWPIVERMIANIDTRLSEPGAREIFAQVRAYLEKIRTNAAENYRMEWGGTQFRMPQGMSGATPSVRSNDRALIDKYLKK